MENKVLMERPYTRMHMGGPSLLASVIMFCHCVTDLVQSMQVLQAQECQRFIYKMHTQLRLHRGACSYMQCPILFIILYVSTTKICDLFAHIAGTGYMSMPLCTCSMHFVKYKDQLYGYSTCTYGSCQEEYFYCT